MKKPFPESRKYEFFLKSLVYILSRVLLRCCGLAGVNPNTETHGIHVKTHEYSASRHVKIETIDESNYR